jgi:glycosyltransferase involved in cell wall biosynthesis
MTGDGGGDREVDGVAVCDSPGLLGLVRAYRDHDVVLTQLQATSRALALAALTRRPVVQFLRMGGPDLAKIVRWPDLMVFNAEWLRRERPWPGPSMVLHPPVFAEEYRTAPGDHVTLVNLNERKGGRLLFELARRLPDHRFLGVVGGWGGQVVPDPVPANVTIMDHVDDARDIYARTRILLMPSSYEP